MAVEKNNENKSFDEVWYEYYKENLTDDSENKEVASNGSYDYQQQRAEEYQAKLQSDAKRGAELKKEREETAKKDEKPDDKSKKEESTKKDDKTADKTEKDEPKKDEKTEDKSGKEEPKDGRDKGYSSSMDGTSNVIKDFDAGLAAARERLKKETGIDVAYDSDEMSTFISKLRDVIVSIENVVRKTDDSCNQIQSSINPETLAQTGDIATLFSEFRTNILKLEENVDEIVNACKATEEGNAAEDEFDHNKLGVKDPESDPAPSGDPKSPSGNRHRGGGNDSLGDDETGFIEQVLPQTPQIINAELIAASIGSLVFSTAINLYQTIGGAAIQSDVNTQYGVLGVVKVNDVFYYKLIDKTTGQIYYATASDVPYTVEALHTKEETMLLNSTDIGSENNFEKLSDVDKYYIVTEKQEINSIEFATVLDPETGKTYYVPVSNSTEYEIINDVVEEITNPVWINSNPTYSETSTSEESVEGGN